MHFPLNNNIGCVTLTTHYLLHARTNNIKYLDIIILEMKISYSLRNKCIQLAYDCFDIITIIIITIIYHLFFL